MNEKKDTMIINGDSLIELKKLPENSHTCVLYRACEQDEIQEDTTSMEEKLEALEELNNEPKLASQQETNKLFGNSMIYTANAKRNH